MSLDLTSVDAKFRWANECLNRINAEVTSRLQPQNYIVSKKINADGTRHGWFFHPQVATDFENLSLMFGDCVHNLRCCLDHFVYAIAIHESGENPPPDANKLAFPLACNARQFHDLKKRISSLSVPVRTAIETVQPYNRPHPDFPPLLGLLGEFDDLDKHRLLHVTIEAFHKTSFGHNIPQGTRFQFLVNTAPLKDGAHIATFVFENPMPKDVIGDFDGDLMLILRHAPSPCGNIGSEIRTLLCVIRNEVKFALDTVGAAVK